MKISYDKISLDYIYPISRSDVSKLRVVVSPAVLEKIASIRFGCNTTTTQEGRTVQRGNQYEVRVNFCLRGNYSRLLSGEKDYQSTIIRFGGKIVKDVGTITWTSGSAKLYACYLLLHEIAHVVYCEQFKSGRLEGRGSASEESWCDEFASSALKSLREAIGIS